jgi:RNA polymerase sigma-70 factor (ECF subfamily)
MLEEHHSAAYGWALFCCHGDGDEAAEVLQSVYLNILEREKPFAGKSTFRTWLFSVIRRSAVKRRSRLRNQLRLLRKYVVETVGPAGIEEKIYRSELRQKMALLLKHLSARQQETLQLVFYHELTVEEAALIMGVSVGSARTHYERGKARLRSLIRKMGIDNAKDARRFENQAAL